jgi:hypothetical protein
MARRCLAWYLILAMLIISISPRAEAAFSSSEPPASCFSDREYDIGVIQAALETKLVAGHLRQRGFNSTEIEGRLLDLSDQQIHKAARQLENLNVGGSGEGVLIGVLVIVLVIIVILPLLGIRVWR